MVIFGEVDPSVLGDLGAPFMSPASDANDGCNSSAISLLLRFKAARGQLRGSSNCRGCTLHTVCAAGDLL